MQQRFFEACKTGDIQTLRSLDYSKIDIYALDEWAFRCACQNGHLPVVQFLLTLEPEYGRIDIHAEDEHGFRRACENGHLDIVQFLLTLEPSHGKIDIHSYNEYAFLLACYYGHLDVIKFLLTLEPEYGRIDIHTDDEYAFRDSNFHIQHLLIRHDPEYNWHKVEEYKIYCDKLNQIIRNLSLLHQIMIQLRTDILELNIVGIVKDYLI
jgi:hypothetical protein